MYLQSTHPNPKIAGGDIYFYRGDVFPIEITLELEDTFDYTVTLSDDDIVRIQILDGPSSVIMEREYKNIENNKIVFNVDDTTTQLLQDGRYMFRVIVEHDSTVTTVVDCTMYIKG
jgi:hypothetical protein